MSPWLSLGFLQTQSDARLLALSRAGHERAFEALVRRYRKPLLAHCHRMRLPTAKAEDAVQQGLLQAWMALQHGADVRDARPWLYRIVHNAALRMIDLTGRGDTELSESLVGAESPDSELDRRITVRETLTGVAALPALQREALIRTAVDGHSHEHVATVLGLSEGAVRGLVYRARITLRNAATALTPSPLVEWFAHAGRKGNDLSQCLAGLGAGGGAAGVSALVKGGAALTAGVLVVGAATIHPRRAVYEDRADASVAGPPAIFERPPIALQASSVGGGGAAGKPPPGIVLASHRSGERSGAREGGSAPRSSNGGDSATTLSSRNGGDGATAPSSSTGGDSTTAPSSSTGGDSTTAPSSSTGGDSELSSSPRAGGDSATIPGSGAGGDSATTSSSSTASDSAATSSTDSSQSSTAAADNLAGGAQAPTVPAGSTSGD